MYSCEKYMHNLLQSSTQTPLQSSTLLPSASTFSPVEIKNAEWILKLTSTVSELQN